VVAASETLKTPAEELLTLFGEFWITDIAKESYGDMINFAGSTFPEFISNLNSMHDRIRISFPNLKPPIINCIEKKDGELTFEYYSERPGLTPMIVGLIRGLGNHFSINVAVTLMQAKKDGNLCDTFRVKHS
jgi:hypothetical protein